MRKLILTLAATLSFCSAQAQTTKGSVALTGSAGYTTHHSKQEKGGTNTYQLDRYDYTLSQGFGLFVRDNLEVGLTAHFFRRLDEHHQYRADNNGIEITTLHKIKGVGLYVRQYKYLTEKLALTGTLSSGINDLYYQTKSVQQDAYQRRYHTEQSTTGAWASLSPGLSYFASGRIALNMNLGALSYSNQTIDSKSSTDYDDPVLGNPSTTADTAKKNTLRLDFSSMHLNLGLTYFLGK